MWVAAALPPRVAYFAAVRVLNEAMSPSSARLAVLRVFSGYWRRHVQGRADD